MSLDFTEGKEWFKFVVSRISDHQGRAGRVEFACFFIGQVIMFYLCYQLDFIFSTFPAFVGVYFALTLVPTLLLIIRRLHDCGYAGKWAVPMLIAFPSLIFLLFWPSDRQQPNQYGFTERLIYSEARPRPYHGSDDAMIDYVQTGPAIEKREEEEEKVEEEIKEMAKEEEKEDSEQNKPTTPSNKPSSTPNK